MPPAETVTLVIFAPAIMAILASVAVIGRAFEFYYFRRWRSVARAVTYLFYVAGYLHLVASTNEINVTSAWLRIAALLICTQSITESMAQIKIHKAAQRIRGIVKWTRKS